MNIVVGDLLTLNDEKYLTMDVIQFNGFTYIFTNKMTKTNEPTNEFVTYKIVEGGLSIVDEEKILNILLPKFSLNVQKMVDSVRGVANDR